MSITNTSNIRTDFTPPTLRYLIRRLSSVVFSWTFLLSTKTGEGQKVFFSKRKQNNALADSSVPLMQKNDDLSLNSEQATVTEAMYLSKASPGYIYLVQAITPNNHYKIGFSKNPIQRIRTLGVQLPFPIEVLHLISTNHTERAEAKLHRKFSHKRLKGEWFDLSEVDVAEILSLSQLHISGVEENFPVEVHIGKLQ